MNKYLTNSSNHFTSCRISTPPKTLKQVQGDELQSECNKVKLQHDVSQRKTLASNLAILNHPPQPVIASVSEAIQKKESPMQTKKAFTLSETVIVLTIIGILTAILLPSIKTMTPNEKIMKFKKGHEAFNKAINELTTSDEYYLNGDLGTKNNGDLIDGFHESDYQYFCKTLADVMNTKTVACNDNDFGWLHAQLAATKLLKGAQIGDGSCMNVINNYCVKSNLSSKVPRIITQDGIIFYEANPKATFGMPSYMDTSGRLFNFDKIGKEDPSTAISNYKFICMDIDDPCKGETPFQFGLRVDGKVLLSRRAQEWLEKSVQEN